MACFFVKRDGRYVLCEGYEILVYANSVHKHETSSGSGQEVEEESTTLQVDESKEIESKCLLQLQCGVLTKKGAV